MEVLTTRAVVERAREHADALRELVRAAPDAPRPRAEVLACGSVVLYEKRPEQLVLWHCARSLVEEAPPLATLSRAELRKLGVPEEALSLVSRARSVAALEGLPPAVAGKLRLLFLQRAGVAPRPEELVRRAVSTDHFEELLSGRIADLLLALDEAQQRIVDFRASGPVLVRGVAGSGKTAILLHRIHRLLRDARLFARPRVLLLAYNRTLAGAARDLLASLGVARDVRVETLHSFARKLAPGRRVVSARERANRIRAAREAVRARSRVSALWAHPDAFFEEELHLIAGRVTRREEYVSPAFRRRGAGRALEVGLRELVWEVHAEYLRGCDSDRVTDWDGVVRLAHERLDREEREPFDAVFVDEAQDLTALAIRLAARVVREPSGLFFALDPAQVIYEPGFRWRDAGVTVHGSHSFALRRNHRSTRAIVELARPVLEGLPTEVAHLGDNDDGEHLIAMEPPTRTGTRPRVLVTPRGQEHAAVAADITRLLERGARPEHVAVLCYHRRVRDAMWRRLTDAGLLCQRIDADHDLRITDPTVKVLTMHSAKGLEFPVVYVLATRSLLAPESPGLRHVLYVALTRAMVELVVVHAEGSLAPALSPALSTMAVSDGA